MVAHEKFIRHTPLRRCIYRNTHLRSGEGDAITSVSLRASHRKTYPVKSILLKSSAPPNIRFETCPSPKSQVTGYSEELNSSNSSPLYFREMPRTESQPVSRTITLASERKAGCSARMVSSSRRKEKAFPYTVEISVCSAAFSQSKTPRCR